MSGERQESTALADNSIFRTSGEAYLDAIASTSTVSKTHPGLSRFFREYLKGEKAVEFNNRLVVNTHFPPCPSRAVDQMADHFLREDGAHRLYSVTIAVTNRCMFNCWHCYNHGRSTDDVPLDILKNLVREVQDLGAVMMNLTGGEPLLRADLEEICECIDDRSCLLMGTTGWGLTEERARRLKERGLFAASISLDSGIEEEHDRMRGRPGAFRAALRALEISERVGLYPYVVSVASPDFLCREKFMSFVRFAGRIGAREVHLLEPSLTGKLAGRSDLKLSLREKDMIINYQREIARRYDLPIFSTLTYLERPEAFGCGAGITHLYIDGGGEVCPCNLVPMSFGNIRKEPLKKILDRMRCYFRRPRKSCAGCLLAEHLPGEGLPVKLEVSESLCREHLPREHEVPEFFRLRTLAGMPIGKDQLKEAYDLIHEDYDDFWVTESGPPTEALVGRLNLAGDEKIFEAGCGSGFATEKIARGLGNGGSIRAVDISPEMLKVAEKRLSRQKSTQIELEIGDALEEIRRERNLDVVFTSWVLGYIPILPFFKAAQCALKEGGKLAFLVHRSDSPLRELEIFYRLIALNPSVLRRQVKLDFPRSLDHIKSELAQAGLEPVHLAQGKLLFVYDSAEEVLEHLIKSGAGTLFYESIDSRAREEMRDSFLELLREENRGKSRFEVIHEYLECIALNAHPGSSSL
jgi:MoaA/NifB/PqqE/SkfB family radical SAM enzyme/SAM-dependent methyltransferase